MSHDARTVYSTEQGRIETPKTAESKRQANPREGIRVRRETKGRKGAGVTLVTGLDLPEAELKTLHANLKKRLGCGGTLKEGVLEFQGEHRDMLLAELLKLGFAAKKAGG